MTNQEVQLLVEKLSMEYFEKPFVHKAYFNDRLRTTGGRYLLQSHNIELNKKSYELFGLDELKGIILHELCHYHLHIEGEGYKHRDRDFRELLNKVGAPRFCSTIKQSSNRRKSNIIHIYECIKCNQQYVRKRRMDVNKFSCGLCYGQLRKIKEIKNNNE